MIKQTILFINPVSVMGGAEESLFVLLKYLDKNKYKIILACPEGDLAQRAQKINIDVVLVNFIRPFKNPFGFLKTLLRIRSIIRKKNIDIIHSNGVSSAQWSMIFGRFFHKIPLIIHLRDLNINKSQKINFRINKKFFYALCISNAVRDYFLNNKCIVKDRSFVVYNGVDLERFNSKVKRILREELGFGPNQFVIGLIGRIDVSKRLEDLIETAFLLKDYQAFRWVIAGSADWSADKNLPEKIDALIAKRGLQDVVFRIGYRSDVGQVMNSLDVLMFPAQNEAFGRVLIEAMACAKPVIAARSGAVTEIIKDGETGYIVPLGDRQSFADRIMKLYREPSLRDELGRKGYEQVIKQFSAQAYVDKVVDIYDNILRK